MGPDAAVVRHDEDHQFRDSLRLGGGQERSTIEHLTYDETEFGPKPVLCGIHGYCPGGGLELAMASDLRIAATDAVFGQPEIGLGCFPGGGTPSDSPCWPAVAGPRNSSGPDASSRPRKPIAGVW